MTRVIANQHRNPSNGRKSMDVLYDDVNPASDHFDAYSTAPYFQYKPAYPYDVNWTVADIDEAFDVIALDFPDIYENMVECKADADARGLDFVAYEGGQHILASGGDENIPALVNLFHTMQRDDRMQQLMKELFENWRELAGGGVFMHYTHVAGYGKFTYWGIHEQFYALANVNPKSRQLYVEIGVPQPTNFIPST